MAKSKLPPGFRFHPTDVELVWYYLKRKIMGKPFRFEAITEIELYKFVPWDLPDKSQLCSKDLEWYFFCPRDRKYPNGSRANRTTENGYWKSTGKDKAIIYNSSTIGMRKSLVFHEGKPPKGSRTDWVMYEYRLESKELVDAGFFQDAYVICKIFQKSGSGPKIGEQYGAPFNEEDYDDDTTTEDFFSLRPESLDVQTTLLNPVTEQAMTSTVIETSSDPDLEIDGISLDEMLQLLNTSLLGEDAPHKIMTTGQKVSFEFCGTNYIFTISQALLEGQVDAKGLDRGIISTETYFVFEASPNSGIKIINQREAASSKIFRHKEFNLEKLGIGGLNTEFIEIFRRAFASRVFPAHVVNKLGIKHVKGMLLHGPPGTGKTLMARQIGKLLNGREPKIVNGPEVLSKYVGETEKNVRDLFADAENDQRTKGDASDLHVIIFDEIDAICKSRGSTRDGTGVHDGIVNQLLTKIDGVESLNNVLLIGMTNRKDLLDEALLRPGRLEVHVEINLPDENGRLQILQIHTNKMKENSFLAADVSLQELAARTKNYSGAELEGVVKSAVSYALNRQISLDDLTKPLDEESIKVTMDDFLNALHEIVPAFGASTDDLERCRLNGNVDCGERHKHIRERAMLLVEQIKVGLGSPLVKCLLEGPSGSGKTAMAATIGLESDFPYVKIISAETMIGLSEASKCAQIVKVFEDAYKSQRSIIILDDIERLLEYVPIGPRFSTLILQTLLLLLKRLPPKGKRLLVIGTTSVMGFLESVDICDVFSVSYHVPELGKEDVKKVLKQLNVFHEDDLDYAAEAVNEIPIKKLYVLVEMAAVGADGKSAAAIYSGQEKIDPNHFFDILRDISPNRY